MTRTTCTCGASLDPAPEPSGRTIHCQRCGRERPDSSVTIRPPAALLTNIQVAEIPAQARQPPGPSRKAVASLILGLASLVGGMAFTGLPAVLLGLLGLRDIRRGQGRTGGAGMALAGIASGVLGVVLVTPLGVYVGLLKIHEAETVGNLRILSRGMIGYRNSDPEHRFPAAAICDKDGTPLLSWRVALLPYTGDPADAALYAQFKLHEPWDGPNNSRLIPLMPKTYALPGDKAAPPGYTYYRVFVGGGDGLHAPFEMQKGPQVPRDFPDGQSNTILVVEAGEAVPWSKPDELVYDPKGPVPPLGGHFPYGFYVVLGDGSLRLLSKNISEKLIRKAIVRNDGDDSPDW